MLKPSRRNRILTTGLLLLVFLQACQMRQRFASQVPVVEETFSAPTEAQEDLVIAPTKAASPTAVPTQITALPSPLTKISITAVKGNLYIRRGPSLAFNPIGVLMEGQKIDVLARDVLSDWAQVAIPDQAGQTGWVSLQTKYSAVDGDVNSLPIIKPEIWPVASYLRNCTYHQMLVSPGDIVLPSLLEYPENVVWIYPGSYTVYDLDHPDEPEVASVELREGYEIDIRVDGNGEKRKCP